jgi:hypothetical protein
VSDADVGFCTKVIDCYADQQKRGPDQTVRSRLVAAQARRAAELVSRVRSGRAVLVDDPVGTGKTVITLAAAARLLACRSVDRVLIVAPNSTVAEQWEDRARQVNRGAYFTRVARRASKGTPKWQQGMLRVVTRRELPSPPPGDARHLVIVDEAHRGLQTTSSTHDRLSEWKDAGRLMLVTATPFQMSMTGLTTMLEVGHVQADDVDALRRYGRDASAAIRARLETNTNPNAAELEALHELSAQATAALARYRGNISLTSELGIPHPPRLDDPASLCRVPASGDWRDAFEVARLVPDLVGLHNGDAFQRRLVSSSEAFWSGAVGTELQTKARRDRAVARFVGHLKTALGKNAEHPKIARSVEQARSWASGPRARHVLIFCVWDETAATIESTLSGLNGRDFDVERPNEVISAALKKRLATPAAANTRSVVVVLQDRFSESIDLDGGEPCLIHHDLPWNPARIRQRWGRVVRASSGFTPVQPDRIHVPVLDVHTDNRLLDTVLYRAEIGDRILLPTGPEEGGLEAGDFDDGEALERGGAYEMLPSIGHRQPR